MAPIVEIEGLTKTYQMGKVTIRALDRVDLQIEEGDFVSVTGPSGAGKSTLLNMVGLLDEPTSGEVLIKGEKTCSLSRAEKASFRLTNLGFVFQFFNLFPELTAVENVALPHMILGRSRAKCRTKAQTLLDKVGLAARMNHRPTELSGGEQQRVAIARALVNDPELLLADEPTGNLDSKTAEQILRFITELNTEGQTVVLVTHEEALAKKARRVVRVVDGTIA